MGGLLVVVPFWRYIVCLVLWLYRLSIQICAARHQYFMFVPGKRHSVLEQEFKNDSQDFMYTESELAVSACVSPRKGFCTQLPEFCETSGPSMLCLHPNDSGCSRISAELTSRSWFLLFRTNLRFSFPVGLLVFFPHFTVFVNVGIIKRNNYWRLPFLHCGLFTVFTNDLVTFFCN